MDPLVSSQRKSIRFRKHDIQPPLVMIIGHRLERQFAQASISQSELKLDLRQ